MTYAFQIVTVLEIYVILAVSLNLLVGYTGLLSLSHAAFCGIGAYLAALALVHLHAPYAAAMAFAVLGTGIIAFLISIPALRLRGDYFMLASLGLQMIVVVVMNNWTGVTGGSDGFGGIPKPSIFGHSLSSIPGYAAFSSLIMCAAVAVLAIIARSPFGRVLKTVREDELAAEALGKSPTRFKTLAFTVSAVFAGVAGVVLAGSTTYIDPGSFTMNDSIYILSMVIIGGVGNLSGPIAGAAFLVLLPEVLRFVGIPDAFGPSLRQLIYAFALILVLRFRPQGAIGDYKL